MLITMPCVMLILLNIYHVSKKRFIFFNFKQKKAHMNAIITKNKPLKKKEQKHKQLKHNVTKQKKKLSNLTTK